MSALSWTMIAIAVMIVLLGILFIFVLKNKKGKHTPDYYTFFVIGVMWVIVGIPMMMQEGSSFFFIMGLVFTVLGLVHKDQWEKNKRERKKFYNKYKIIWLIIIGVLVLLVLYGTYVALKGSFN